MENGSAIKKLEIRKDNSCPTCHIALEELIPIAKEHDIPVEIKQPLDTDDLIPVVCMVEDDIKTCFQGYDKRVKKLFKMFIKQ